MGRDDTDEYFRDDEHLSKCVTWNAWVPLSCFDVANVVSYCQVFGSTRPNDDCTGGPYFFRNFPINYVYVTGYVWSIQGQPSQWQLRVSDGTGPLVLARTQSSMLSLEHLVGQFVEIYGMIVEHGTYPRMVDARTLRVIPNISLNKVFNLYAEAFRVRREILEKGWQTTTTTATPEPVPAVRSDTVVDSRNSRPLLSLSRSASLLAGSKQFQLIESLDAEDDGGVLIPDPTK